MPSASMMPMVGLSRAHSRSSKLDLSSNKSTAVTAAPNLIKLLKHALSRGLLAFSVHTALRVLPGAVRLVSQGTSRATHL